ncbi:hypothetical protein ACE7GA_14620 [Roseomonas sp. CCTCC AB2023176]|uniref:hypothetical protein n=1 Tax=Roseomonas sp. CCTCC AB2023176 TaxID=3342640 RepID=UPI0035D899C7
MLYRLRRTLHRVVFDAAVRGVLSTPPVRLRAAPLRVVTMLSSQDLRMYLVAIKSFYRFLPGGGVTVMDDGSLTPADHAALRHHVPGIEIMPLLSVNTGICPRGNCWERLLHILDLSRDGYVIQMDSDVLTVAPVPEVVAAIESNTAFTLGSEAGTAVVSLDEAGARAATMHEGLTQVRAERLLPGLPADMGRRYIRGSAGFAGFARGGSSRAAAEAFSGAMAERMGQRWTEWGTEQVASNYLVANSRGGLVLPWPAYCCFYPGVDHDSAALLHFIGTWRYRSGVFVRGARRVVRALSVPALVHPEAGGNVASAEFTRGMAGTN